MMIDGDGQPDRPIESSAGGGFEPEDLRRFALTFQRFLEAVVQDLPGRSQAVADSIEEVLDPERGLVIITVSFDVAEHASVQAGLDWLMADDRLKVEFRGVTSDKRSPAGITLAHVIAPKGPAMSFGPVEYVEAPVGVDQTRLCFQNALGVGRYGDAPIVVLVRGSAERPGSAILVEVATNDPSVAEGFVQELRKAVDTRNVARGQVISFEAGPYGGSFMVFKPRFDVTRDDIVLPAGVLERIERYVSARPSRDSQDSRLRRGALLHGPPGTGKTLTAQYLVSRMKSHTVVLLSGRSLAALGQAASLARRLAPSMVVLDDVDLIATDRSGPSAPPSPGLFTLLDELDGMKGDCDVVYLLTTNRPWLLDEALSNRPGRIDLSVAFEPPDADLRGRLLRRFLGDRGPSDPSLMESLVDRTADRTPAFLRELVRRAQLVCGARADLTTEHLDEALAELEASAT